MLLLQLSINLNNTTVAFLQTALVSVKHLRHFLSSSITKAATKMFSYFVRKSCPRTGFSILFISINTSFAALLPVLVTLKYNSSFNSNNLNDNKGSKLFKYCLWNKIIIILSFEDIYTIIVEKNKKLRIKIN